MKGIKGLKGSEAFNLPSFTVLVFCSLALFTQKIPMEPRL
ncbi:MAG: hypothetical protein ACI85S_001078, partial [Pseudohongiellaceae bacterium]